MYFTYSSSLKFLQTIAIERWLAKQMGRKINDFFWQTSRQKFSVLHLFFQLKRFFNVVYLWIFVLFYSQLPWFVVRFQLLSSLKDKHRASLNLESRNSTERLRSLHNILIAKLVKLPILYEEAYFAVIRQPFSEYSDRVRGHSEGHPMISSGTRLGKLGSLKIVCDWVKCWESCKQERRSFRFLWSVWVTVNSTCFKFDVHRVISRLWCWNGFFPFRWRNRSFLNVRKLVRGQSSLRQVFRLCLYSQ